MQTIWALIAGSIAGGLARFYLAGFIQRAGGASFPWGTFAVNLAGCFLIGLFASWAGQKSWFNPQMKILLMTGFCGAFTTFSAFMLETSNLTSSGDTLKALIYIVSSVAAGFLLFRAGAFLGASF